MKQIEAYVRTDRANEVLDALKGVGVVHATLTHVIATGPNLDPETTKTSVEFGRPVNRMVKLALLCPDKDEVRLVEVIREAARTGRPGDGVISVQNINRLVKIRTAAESIDAL